MQYKIEKTDDEKTTIGRILRANGISGRTLKKIRHGAGKIMIANQLVDEKTRIKQPTTIKVILRPEQVDPNVVQCNTPIDIVSEDEYFLALNKNAHTTSVPGPANSTTTLANQALGYGQRQASPFVPHILTRLDYDTSGVVLFAKSNFVQSMVQTQISDHTMKKEYFAVTSGVLPKNHAMIDLKLRKENFESARRIVADDGKPAQTEYWVVERFNNATLVRIRLHTGRTHQIRAHFAHLGFPLIGDELYGGPTTLISRQMLHAAHLELINPFTKQPQTFDAPLAADFENVLAKLRSAN